MSPNSTDKSNNPNEDLSIPKWINEDYFQKILQKDEPNYSKILSLNSVAATAPGENYTSIMVRVQLNLLMQDGSNIQKSYILKTTFETDNAATAILTAMNLFPKEKMMYQSLLPQFVQLYNEAGIKIQLSPQCIHVEDTPEHITLVMKDLREKNFKNFDRLNGLDMPHITQALRKLAELHAASATYYELNGPYPELFQKGFYTEQNRPVFQTMAASRRELYEKAMRTWGLENVENYISKMLQPMQLFDEALRISTPNPTKFNVLNHGDCWVNNIMFNYKDNGEIDETLFVDFQIGTWGSPTNDLWYLITTSVSLDIKVKEYDHFIQIYHTRLAECLKLLKYPKRTPTLKELHISMLEDGLWSLIIASGVMVAVLMPSDKESNMDNMIKEGKAADEYKYKTFINPYYAKAMCQLFPFLENKGIL